MIRRVLHLIREEYHSSVNGIVTDPEESMSLALSAAAATVANVENRRRSSTTALNTNDDQEDEEDGEDMEEDLEDTPMEIGSLAHHQLSVPSQLYHVPPPMPPTTSYSYSQPFSNPSDNLTRPVYQLKPLVLQAMGELIDELDGVGDALARQGFEHIHAGETVLTIGRSRSVERLLIAVGRKRSFRVIVAEGPPSSRAGHDLAMNLAKEGIDTILMPDAAVFALMPRINKIFLGCHAADGGIIAPSGCKLVTTAARYYAKPVYIVSGLYKITPIYPEHDDSYILMGSPCSLSLPSLPADAQPVHLENPLFDFIPATDIALFVTNTGGHHPSFIYRILRDMYDPEDDKFLDGIY